MSDAHNGVEPDLSHHGENGAPRPAECYDLRELGALVTLEPGDSHPAIAEAQAYLRRFGYFDLEAHHAPAARTLAMAVPIGMTIGRLDAATADAVRSLQRARCLPETGAFDEATIEAMRRNRCGLSGAPPTHPLAVAPLRGWDTRHLRVAFDAYVPSELDPDKYRAAVSQALDSWRAAGVGLTFEHVTIFDDPHIEFAWRTDGDGDFDMVGAVVAHADFPPGANRIVSRPPLPVHFDETEQWGFTGGAADIDVETVALHEVGHCLGLPHIADARAAMYEETPHGRVVRQPHTADLDLLRSIYS